MFLDALKMFFALDVVIPPLIIPLVVAPILYQLLKRGRSQILVAPGIGRSSWYTVGGGTSRVYYDIDRASSELKDQEAIDKWYVDNVKEINKKGPIDYLVFVERKDGSVGAITKKDKISSELGINSFIVRPKKRIYASQSKGVNRNELSGKKVVIISDVATTGHSIKEVIRILDECDVRTVGVITVVYRQDQAEGRLLKDYVAERSISFRYADESLRRYEPGKNER